MKDPLCSATRFALSPGNPASTRRGQRAAWLWAGLLFLAHLNAVGAVIYVNQNAAGSETNGQSWTSAFRTVQSALNSAQAGDEVWVAAGTYYEIILLNPGIALYGGFAGTETGRAQRNWSAHETILHGAPYLYNGDPASSSEWVFVTAFNRAVVIAAGATPQTRLDGFTIRNGYATVGGGIYVEGGSPTIANNTIVNNSASSVLGGGGVLVDVTRTLPSQSAIEFFTNVANGLLRSQLPFGITNIPVYPTNCYSPTVHRLLQLAANLYDASSTNQFPSVFRPTFGFNGTSVFIIGYYFDNDAGTVDGWLTNNPYGIPMVIGAKKGIPNFNEYAMQTAVLASRKLQLVRANTNLPPHQTNEMYIIGISNFCGLEAWNSYTQAFAGDLEMRVGNVIHFTLTNSSGLFFTNAQSFAAVSNITAGSWSGYPGAFDPSRRYSFKVPLSNSVVVLSNSAYRPGPPASLDSATNVFTAGSGFSVPDWKLVISNRLTYVLSSGGKILDFVLLANLTNTLDISGALMGQQISPLPNEGFAANCWKTNRLGNSSDPRAPTDGIQSQMDISLGVQPVSLDTWRSFNLDAQWYTMGDDMIRAIESFQVFVLPQIYTNRANSNLVQQAPFSPTRKLVRTFSWQVNDPLVHYLPDHLQEGGTNTSTVLIKPNNGIPTPSLILGDLNDRYQPWGGNPLRVGYDPTAYNRAIKDSVIVRSDDWDFPASPNVNLRWLDRVHRGTPWQTVYLNTEVASPSDWLRQSSDMLAHPTNDWSLVDLFLANAFLPGIPDASAPVLVNNTIAKNYARRNGGGIYVVTNAVPTLINNIVADNSSGIFSQVGAAPVLRNNCISGNAAYDYSGLTPGTNDLSSPPGFVKAGAGNFQLLATSPCRDAGDDAVLAAGWLERTGDTAVQGAHLDIGAHEFGPGGVPVISTFQVIGPTAEPQFVLKGFAGQSYLVEASENLLDWAPLSTNVAALGEFIFRDAAATNFTHRFYRAALRP